MTHRSGISRIVQTIPTSNTITVLLSFKIFHTLNALTLIDDKFRTCFIPPRQIKNTKGCQFSLADILNIAHQCDVIRCAVFPVLAMDLGKSSASSSASSFSLVFSCSTKTTQLRQPLPYGFLVTLLFWRQFGYIANVSQICC